MTDLEQENPPIAEILSQMNVPHVVFHHAGSVRSLEQAAQERGQNPDQVIRSILFRVDRESYVLVLVAGPAQISWKALRRHLGQSRVTMASPEEVEAVTGYAIGTVGPLGLNRPVPILVDQTVLTQDQVSLGSGMRNVAIILQTADLLAILEPFERVNFGMDQGH